MNPFEKQLFAKGNAGSDEYWNIVYSTNDIAQIFGFTYIYYVRLAGNTFQFLFSSEQNPRDYTLEEIFMNYELVDIPDAMREACTEQKIAIRPRRIRGDTKRFSPQEGT